MKIESCIPATLFIALRIVVCCIAYGCAATESDPTTAMGSADSLSNSVASATINCSRQSPTNFGAVWGEGQTMRACLEGSAAEVGSCLEEYFRTRSWPYDAGLSRTWMYCNGGDAAVTLWVRRSYEESVTSRSCTDWPTSRETRGAWRVEVAAKLPSETITMLDSVFAVSRETENNGQDCVSAFHQANRRCGSRVCDRGDTSSGLTDSGRLHVVRELLEASGMPSSDAARVAAAIVARPRIDVDDLDRAALVAALYRASAGARFPETTP